jgi:hypothetical protein
VISRRGFITGFVTGLTPLAATASAQEYKAQQAGKIPRIGMLLQVLERGCAADSTNECSGFLGSDVG